MARRFGRQRVMYAKIRKHAGYGADAAATLATATGVVKTIAHSVDSPDYSLIYDGTNAINVENGSTIRGYVDLRLYASSAVTGIATAILYRDPEDQLTDFSGHLDFWQNPQSEAADNRRKNTHAVRRVIFSSNREQFTMRLPIKRRLSFMKGDSKLKLFIFNGTTGTITHAINARINSYC